MGLITSGKVLSVYATIKSPPSYTNGVLHMPHCHHMPPENTSIKVTAECSHTFGHTGRTNKLSHSQNRDFKKVLLKALLKLAAAVATGAKPREPITWTPMQTDAQGRVTPFWKQKGQRKEVSPRRVLAGALVASMDALTFLYTALNKPSRIHEISEGLGLACTPLPLAVFCRTRKAHQHHAGTSSRHWPCLQILL